MHPTTGLTRKLAVVAATGALAAGIAAPAQADPPGDRASWAPTTASVRPDDRADRAGPPTSPVAASARAESGAAFEPGDALGIALVVTAIGLGVGAMVYAQRLGSA
jgi:hypothetical protein